jgi:hypothetical protein
MPQRMVYPHQIPRLRLPIGKSAPSPRCIDADGLSLSTAEKLIKDNGGIITTSITDPKLSHIITDDEDSSRYAELVRKTSKPKHKHIILPSWVDECIDENTLMNEDGKFFDQ